MSIWLSLGDLLQFSSKLGYSLISCIQIRSNPRVLDKHASFPSLCVRACYAINQYKCSLICLKIRKTLLFLLYESRSTSDTYTNRFLWYHLPVLFLLCYRSIVIFWPSIVVSVMFHLLHTLYPLVIMKVFVYCFQHYSSTAKIQWEYFRSKLVFVPVQYTLMT